MNLLVKTFTLKVSINKKGSCMGKNLTQVYICVAVEYEYSVLRGYGRRNTGGRHIHE